MSTETIRATATEYLAAGLSVIPIRTDGSKASVVPWKDFQSRLPSQAEVDGWFLSDAGMAIIYGQVSSNAELIDLDQADLFQPYREQCELMAPGVFDLLTLIRTPRGFHVVYRCPEVAGNMKLAQDVDGVTLIETRGQGGYALAPGSPPECHETGLEYEHIAGPPLTKLHEITPAQRRLLHLAAGYFNVLVEDTEPTHTSTNNGSPSPGNSFNAKANWEDILAPHGWLYSHRCGDIDHWTRPGKETGTSATTGAVSDSGNELFCCFSSNARPFQGATGSRPCSTYTKFACHAVLNHGGDYKAAAADLTAKGYGPKKLLFGGLEADQSHQEEQAEPPVEGFTLAELQEQYPTLKPPVVDGLFREGETCNLISASKIGKSWLAYDLLISVVTGRPWLGLFKTKPGRVLLIDNELHKPTLAHRIPRVGDAMELFASEYMDQIDIWPLRGRLRSLIELGTEFKKIQRGQYRLILFDSKYRFSEPGTSENDNTTEMLIYNLLDQYAGKLGAALVLIHHSSKGSQSDKRITDVGAGAGAQSRAADCHIVLREHEEPDTVVLAAAVRSFPPVEPIALRWEFPLWVPDEFADPRKLKGRISQKEQQQADRDKEGMDQIVTALLGGPATASSLREATGTGYGRMRRLLELLISEGHVQKKEIIVRGNPCDEYRLSEAAK